MEKLYINVELCLGPLCLHGRTVTVDPDGVLIPKYNGEKVYQTITNQWWEHITGTEWSKLHNG